MGKIINFVRFIIDQYDEAKWQETKKKMESLTEKYFDKELEDYVKSSVLKLVKSPLKQSEIQAWLKNSPKKEYLNFGKKVQQKKDELLIKINEFKAFLLRNLNV